MGPNDYQNIYAHISYCKKNIKDYRNIYIITAIELNIEDTIVINEKSFPFKKEDINIRADRNKWYFQQLLKLYSFTIPGILDNYLVIDADTFFIKETEFFENGIPLYNIGTEYNQDYFTHNQLLHPTFTRASEHSGICHHMMFNKFYIQEIFQLVSPEDPDSFWKVWISKVNPTHWSGASEYELYFHFMMKYHNDKIKIRPLKWDNLTFLSTVTDLDYISIHWYTI